LLLARKRAGAHHLVLFTIRLKATFFEEGHFKLFLSERLGQLQGEVLPMHQRQDAPLRLPPVREYGSNRTFAGARWQVRGTAATLQPPGCAGDDRAPGADRGAGA